MAAPEILVTGGTGTLGRRVVERWRARGDEARVMSRSGRPGTIKGDLLTGEGIAAAVRGVDAIVHCASGRRRTRQTDVAGTEILLREAARAGVAHVVFISIVGVDRNPFVYYRTKLDAERVVEHSPVPWTILRATQFHDLLLATVGALSRAPWAVPVPKGLRLQPIDAGEVADRLVELALVGPAGRAPDIGGPEVRTLADLAQAYLEATDQTKRIVEVPTPGKVARAFREGAQLAPGAVWGTVRWEAFLGNRLGPATADAPVAEV